MTPAIARAWPTATMQPGKNSAGARPAPTRATTFAAMALMALGGAGSATVVARAVPLTAAVSAIVLRQPTARASIAAQAAAVLTTGHSRVWAVALQPNATSIAGGRARGHPGAGDAQAAGGAVAVAVDAAADVRKVHA